MAGIGIFLILMGYTLVYAGIKDVSAMGEISYGLGIGPDPFVVEGNAKTEEETTDYDRQFGGKNSEGLLSGTWIGDLANKAESAVSSVLDPLIPFK